MKQTNLLECKSRSGHREAHIHQETQHKPAADMTFCECGVSRSDQAGFATGTVHNCKHKCDEHVIIEIAVIIENAVMACTIWLLKQLQ